MYPLCRHIKTNGLQCQSPAVRQQPFCYYHGTFRERGRVTGQSSNPNCMTRVREDDGTVTLEPFRDPGHNTLELGLLEDADSIQVAISTVVTALARNSIDSRRASRLLYGLRLAASNVQHLPRRKVKNRNDLLTATTTLHGETVAPDTPEIAAAPDCLAPFETTRPDHESETPSGTTPPSTPEPLPQNTTHHQAAPVPGTEPAPELPTQSQPHSEQARADQSLPDIDTTVFAADDARVHHSLTDIDTIVFGAENARVHHSSADIDTTVFGAEYARVHHSPTDVDTIVFGSPEIGTQHPLADELA